MAMLKRLCFVLILLCSSNVFAQLADAPWPKFHKDEKNTGFSSNFGTQVGKLKWKFATGGPVTSSPVIDNNGTVYFGSADNYFYAVSGETGAIQWNYRTGGAIELCSAAIDEDGVVYIGSNDGYLYAFDTNTIDPKNKATWKEKWKFKTSGAITSSPTIHSSGSIIVGSNDGYVYSISSSGTLQWKQYIGATWCSPSLDPDKNQLYIGVWEPQDSPITTVQYTVDNETITIPAQVNFYALNASSGAFLWDFPGVPIGFCVPGGILASPVVTPDGGILIAYFITWKNPDPCDSDLWQYNIFKLNSSGRELWALNIDSDADIYSTPAVIADNSFFVASKNKLSRIVPDTTNYLFSTSDGQRIESSPAVDGKKNIFVGSNGGRFYCICADCPETPVLWQYPPKDQDPLKTPDGLTIASIISSPAIGDDVRHSVYVGASDGNVYAFYDGPRIAGKIVLESDGSPLQAVKVTLTSTFTDTVQETYTDPNGEYSFVGVENYTYTVTPEKLGYVFTPPQRTAVIKQDKDALNINFTAFDGFKISGKVVQENGSPLEGVLITIEGTTSKVSSSTTTDANGQYEFSGLGYDTYTITPSRDGYGFDPPSQTKIISSQNAGSQRNFTLSNFTAFQGYQISGMVLDLTKLEGQAGIQGVTIQLTGKTTDGVAVNLSKTTDSEGKYSFTGLSNGAYTVTPISAAYNFEPESQKVTIASANALNINFYAGTGYIISGSIAKGESSSDNESLSSFLVELYKDNATLMVIPLSQKTAINTVNADAKGNFVFIGVPPGSYIVKPKKEGYGFEPLFYNVVVRNDSVSNLLFTATKGLYISGKVVNIIGIGQSNITLTIDNVSGTESSQAAKTVTSKDGVYSFTGLSSGDYVISISDDLKDYYQSLPESRTVTLTSQGKEDVNFIVSSYCSTVYLAFPFAGLEGTLVNVFGINFGWSEPLDNETVQVTLGSQSDTIPAGVYFGTDDLSTWVKAKVKSWSPVKILVEAPQSSMIMPFNLVKVWVVRQNRNTEVTATESESAGCFEAAQTDFFLYLY